MRWEDALETFASYGSSRLEQRPGGILRGELRVVMLAGHRDSGRVGAEPRAKWAAESSTSFLKMMLSVSSFFLVGRPGAHKLSGSPCL